MAVNRRFKSYSGQRIDVPHLRSLESAVANDFDSVMRGVLTGLGRPFVARGFDVVVPQASIQASALTIKVADSAVLHATASEPGTILTVPANAADEVLSDTNARVVGSFQNGVANYVSLDYKRVTDAASIDQTAGFSPSEGIEVQRTVPIADLLDYRFVITTSSFGSLLPLYIVGVDSSGFVTYVTKATPGLFRLGRGGSNPQPTFSFDYRNLANPQTGNRREWVNTNPITPNPVSVVPGDDANAFEFGDWSIKSLKDWMDAVMTRFKEITGSNYWYTDTAFGPVAPGSFNLFDVWWDSGAGSVLTGAGNITYNVVLEANEPSAGIWQSKLVDSGITTGDAYVRGVTSGTTARISSYVNNRLIVNSLTNESGFLIDEPLEGRRIYRPVLSMFKVDDDFDDGTTRFARAARIPNTSGSFAAASSWSYVGKVVTVNTSVAHDLTAGQLVELSDLNAATNSPNGTHMIKAVPSATSFVVVVARVPTGAATLGSANNYRLDNQTTHPYIPRFPVSSWSASGTTLTLVVPNHTFTAPVTRNGDTHTSTLIDNLASTADLAVGMEVTGSNIPPGTYITEVVGPSSIRISAAATSTATVSLTFKWFVHLTGLTSTVPADDRKLNSRFTVDNVQPDGDIEVMLSSSLSGAYAASASSYLRPDHFSFNLTVDDAIPGTYNVTDVVAQAFSPTELLYPIGPTLLPPQPAASGPITMDGVTAVSTVKDPIQIKRIENSGSNVRVTAFVPHDVTVGGPKTVTIYGNTALSGFIRTYTDVTVSQPVVPAAQVVSMTRAANVVTVVTNVPHELTSGESIQVSGSTPSSFDAAEATVTFLSAASFSYPSVGANGTTSVQPTITKLNQFVMAGSNLPFASAYVNGGSDDTFLNSPGNPYPGPIEWDDDIYVKGVIGDKYFKIPKTATADGAPTANQFNVDGQTGTAFLQDRQVAYVVLERNLPVSGGQVFSCSAGGPIVGSSPPLDVHGATLAAGDFVKFDTDPETMWFRIASVLGNTINLVSDETGLTPSADQRPAASGPLRYAKGTYDTVTVQPHWLVENSPETYWLAVRRDNGSPTGQMYFRGLELRPGESVNVGNQVANNLLVYTGAGNEAATAPNYTNIDQSGSWQGSQDVDVVSIDADTHEVTFLQPPELGFQKGDKLRKVDGANTYNFTIDHMVTTRTVVVEEDPAPLLPSDTVTYFRRNYAIEDPDNLTLAIRKEDRELARVNTNLARPVYDESVYLQQINLSGVGTVKSGSFIYKGTYPTNITALAYVLHGSANASETIEGNPVTMPGGGFGANSILVHVYFGSFDHGDAINQNGAPVGTRTVNNPTNPPFVAPAIPGDLSTGTEIVLPPNRRTQVVSGSAYVVWPTHASYKASTDPALAGEELLVVANDTLRQAELDYRETFGGPKAKIRVGRPLPINTRIRFRILGSVGSAISSAVSSVSLQLAYNAGNTIVTAIGVPVVVTASDFASNGTALRLTGNLEIDGRSGPNVINGVTGPLAPNADQAFLIGKESNKPKEVWTALGAVKSQVAWDGSGWLSKSAAQVTTTAAPTVVTGSDVVVPVNRAMRVCMTIVGREAAGLGHASYRIEGLFKRVAGNVTLVGSPVSYVLGQDGSGTLTSFIFGITNPDTVQGVLIGHPTQTWYWASTIEYQQVETSA
jgi:hypothetical protein